MIFHPDLSEEGLLLVPKCIVNDSSQRVEVCPKICNILVLKRYLGCLKPSTYIGKIDHLCILQEKCL